MRVTAIFRAVLLSAFFGFAIACVGTKRPLYEGGPKPVVEPKLIGLWMREDVGHTMSVFPVICERTELDDDRKMIAVVAGCNGDIMVMNFTLVPVGKFVYASIIERRYGSAIKKDEKIAMPDQYYIARIEFKDDSLKVVPLNPTTTGRSKTERRDIIEVDRGGDKVVMKGDPKAIRDWIVAHEDESTYFLTPMKFVRVKDPSAAVTGKQVIDGDGKRDAKTGDLPVPR